MRYNFTDDNICAITDSINDHFGFFDKYPLTVNDLINFCGGVPNRNIDFLIIEAVALSEDSIRITVQTNQYECNRTIDFYDMDIDNNGLYVNNPGYWVGTTLFLNQVKFARSNGFSQIRVIAEGPDVNHRYTGHYKWGRVGFKMNKFDHNEFHIWANRHKRNEYDLGELLLSQEGCRIWMLAGFTWAGKFLLDDNSECMMYLEDYLDREGIDFNLYK